MFIKRYMPLLLVIACCLGLAIGMALALTACTSRQEEEPETVAPTPDPEPEPEPIYDPLTGLEVAAEPTGRTYLVSIDNNPDARPHSGISQAKILYEVPAEGGISRLIALFQGDTVEKIGPVRSARPYMVDIARSWGGVFVHCGWSEDAKAYLQQGVVDYVNELYQSAYFWRSDDRSAPHNLYTSAEKLAEWAADTDCSYDQALDWMEFRTEGEAPAGVAVDYIQVEYPYADNIYRYDPATGLYKRFLGEEPFVDQENGQQLTPANIIVMEVVSQVLDGEGRLAIDLTAGGRMWCFSGGKLVEGVWSHPDKDTAIRFTDSTGQAVRLTPGQTCIQVIDGQVNLNYENTAAPEPDAHTETTPESGDAAAQTPN